MYCVTVLTLLLFLPQALLLQSPLHALSAILFVVMLTRPCLHCVVLFFMFLMSACCVFEGFLFPACVRAPLLNAESRALALSGAAPASVYTFPSSENSATCEPAAMDNLLPHSALLLGFCDKKNDNLPPQHCVHHGGGVDALDVSSAKHAAFPTPQVGVSGDSLKNASTVDTSSRHHSLGLISASAALGQGSADNLHGSTVHKDIGASDRNCSWCYWCGIEWPPVLLRSHFPFSLFEDD